MTRLTSDAALTIVTTIIAEARTRELAPLCVAVLDAGGHPLMLWRDDRAAFGRADIARAKASSCLALGFGGRELARRAGKNPGFYGALGDVLPGGFLPAQGGVLIRAPDGELLGAVGITGDTGDNDELCAAAGIAAAGLVAEFGA
jgi:uncharacterized protein GlcG (DUF336 family)